MKKILLVLLGLLFCLNAQAMEFVQEGFYPEERVVDVRGCSVHNYNSPQFLYCVNVEFVCYHKVLEKPIGDFFGIKLLYPVLNNETGEYDWVDKIVKSLSTDTTVRDWCVSIGIDIK